MLVAAPERNELDIDLLTSPTLRQHVMNAEWQAVLQQAGATWLQETVAHFGQPEAEEQALRLGEFRCDLSHRGLIAVRGPDSATFLQGQLSCDVQQATLERSVLGAYCNPQGRTLACFRLWQEEGGYLLTLPRALVAPTLTCLGRYVLRAKVALADASDSVGRMGVAGSHAVGLLEEYGSTRGPSLAADKIRRVNQITICGVPGCPPRFELYGPAQELGALWNQLSSQLLAVGTESWRLLDILAGIPTVYPATVAAFVPQMLNLDRLGGIGWQKGCYTGQEIVARTHYLGKLKRRMILARVECPTPPQPGAALFSPHASASQSAGQLVDAARHPDGDFAVLAVVLLACAEPGGLQLGAVDGPTLRLESLPYALTDPA
ncbi:MAG: folate-binding protein [Candidatus Contendobacter sp.]